MKYTVERKCVEYVAERIRQEYRHVIQNLQILNEHVSGIIEN